MISRLTFPYSEKMPSTNVPVSIFGQISRNQREHELEYHLNKQFNTVGIRVQNKFLAVEQQFNNNQKTNQLENLTENQPNTSQQHLQP